MAKNESSKREENSMRNITAGIIYQVITLLLNFVSKSVIMQKMGVEYLGIQGLYSNIFVLFSFAEFGMAAAMTFALYRPLANKDQQEIAALFQFFHKIYLVLAGLTLGIGLICLVFLKYLVNSALPFPEIILYYVLFLIATVISNAYIFQTYLIAADQKRYVILLVQTIFDGISLFLGIIILYFTKNYAVFILNIILKNILFNLVIRKYLKKHYAFIDKKSLLLPDKKIEIIRNVKDLFIYKFASAMLNSTDNIYISVLVGTAVVGYYSNYQFVVLGVSAIIGIIFSSIAASVGNLLVERPIEKQHQIFLAAQRISMWIVGFAITCFYVLVQDFIKIWMGEDAVFSVPLVIIITVNFYMSSIREITSIFREAAGLFAKIKTAVIIRAVINIILSGVLGYYFGLFGIFFASFLSILSTTFWYEPALLYRSYFKKSGKAFLFIQAESIASLLICVFITMKLISGFEVTGYLSFFIKAVICGIISNLFYLIWLSFHREELRIIIHMIKNFLKSFYRR